MNNSVLQVPINKQLKNQALIAASNLGFSSLQETVRVFLTQLTQNNVSVSFTSTNLSASAQNRYQSIDKDIKNNKNLSASFDNADSLIKHLSQ